MAIDPHNYPGPLEDLEKKRIGKNPTATQTASWNIGGIIVAVLIIGLAGFIFLVSEGEIEIDDWEFLSAIPFWLIILISITAGSKKKKNQTKPKRDVRTQIMAIILISAIGLLFATGLVVFLLASNM